MTGYVRVLELDKEHDDKVKKLARELTHAILEFRFSIQAYEMEPIRKKFEEIIKKEFP